MRPARQAVDAPRGEILVYHGEPVDAVYSHSCGGTLSTASDVWGTQNAGWSRNEYDTAEARTPDLSNWGDAHDFTSNHGAGFCNPGNAGYPNYGKGTYRWTKSFTGADFSDMADRMYHTGRVRDVVVDKRTASGRVARLRIIGEDREVSIHRELEIREATATSNRPCSPSPRRPTLAAASATSPFTAPAGVTVSACARWVRSSWPIRATITAKSSAIISTTFESASSTAEGVRVCSPRPFPIGHAVLPCFYTTPLAKRWLTLAGAGRRASGAFARSPGNQLRTATRHHGQEPQTDS